MAHPTWLRSKNTPPVDTPSCRLRKTAVRLEVERLEERCLLSTTNAAVIPAPSFALPWWAQREAQVAAMPASGAQVVFLGDSITDWFGSGSGAAVWNSALAPLHAADFGILSSTTQNVRWQIDSGRLDGMAPKAVVLMIGTNNLTSGDTPAQTAAGVAAVVADIQAHQPQATILLFGILPRGQSPFDPLRAEIAQTNSLIAQLGNGTSVHYLDIGGAFVQPNGTISPAVMADYLHPTALGYAIWTAFLEPQLQALLPAPAPLATVALPPAPSFQVAAPVVSVQPALPATPPASSSALSLPLADILAAMNLSPSPSAAPLDSSTAPTETSATDYLPSNSWNAAQAIDSWAILGQTGASTLDG